MNFPQTFHFVPTAVNTGDRPPVLPANESRVRPTEHVKAGAAPSLPRFNEPWGYLDAFTKWKAKVSRRMRKAIRYTDVPERYRVGAPNAEHCPAALPLFELKHEVLPQFRQCMKTCEKGKDWCVAHRKGMNQDWPAGAKMHEKQGTLPRGHRVRAWESV